MQEGNTRRFQAFQKMLHLLLGSVKPSLRHLHEHDAGGKHTTLSRLLKMLHLLLGSIKPSLRHLHEQDAVRKHTTLSGLSKDASPLAWQYQALSV